MPNRLALESSPYLLQHAHNPVDWWPWSDAALAAARESDKPILLSVGYSACHWCHVMAHESFENEATARVMNAQFVCIKVDREERPDLDKIYQLAHHALTGRGGGWPLTVFLAPDDLVPFYAGTYFPQEPRYGMPPFVYVLDQVRNFWDQRRDDVRKQNAALRDFLDGYADDAAYVPALDDGPIRSALQQMARSVDPVHGGHVGAPKFPHCPEMELLLDLATPDARAMVELTLARMADGGIHDQIGGGFCRYSVDERWEIPHFEKMLYDNAQLLPLYAQLAQTQDDRFDQIVCSTVDWLAREMPAPDGAFCAALDADSEGEEGKYYVWQRDEVRALLSEAEFAVAERRYGFDRPANFEHAAWNPIAAASSSAISAALGLAEDEVRARLRHARNRLLAAREQRVRPGRDDKVLTAWNALLIGGLARTDRLRTSWPHARPGEKALLESALDVLFDKAWRNGRLYASVARGAGKFPGYLDDHAFLLDALIEVLQQRWRTRDLHWAIALADALLARFEDTGRGGFWFTAHDHEALIQRPKPWMDEAIPSGNGIAARALLRLGHLLGETRYLDAAERTLRAAYPTLRQRPQGCPSLLRALHDFLAPRTLLVVRFSGDAERHAWQAAIDRTAMRRTDAYFVPDAAVELRGSLAAQTYLAGGVAYVCQGAQCDAPITDPAELHRRLGAGGA